MQTAKLFTDYNLPPELQPVLEQSGITTLFPPQAEAIRAGVLKGKNLLLSVPTAAGKTLVAELCMLKALLKGDGRCLYIVPLKALAAEKCEDFKKKYSSLGIGVGMATGDENGSSSGLNQCRILIATPEKVDSLLRARTPWLINGLKVIVLDEIHFLNDGSRGPTLEILTARIRQLNRQPAEQRAIDPAVHGGHPRTPRVQDSGARTTGQQQMEKQ